MLERALGRCLEAGNARIRTVERSGSNPLPTGDLAWDAHVRSHHEEIRDEWLRFRTEGGRLPRIEDMLAESQGNTGSWQAGLLISNGRPSTLLAKHFPATVSALDGIPGLRSALWSVLGADTEIPGHRGPNAGVLRYHLGVACPDRSGLRVGEQTIEYRDGVSVLFDDTEWHSAWNHGDRERVTLFCDLLKPLPAPWNHVNLLGQRVLSLDHRYRLASARADAWHGALNPALMRTDVQT